MNPPKKTTCIEELFRETSQLTALLGVEQRKMMLHTAYFLCLCSFPKQRVILLEKILCSEVL